MWHEARKHERKLRGMMVDYKKRAERRREYYEKIKKDPAQFLQVHGRACKIHLDSAVALAAESPLNMMPWQGDTNNMIDRFDVRAHLDYILEYTPPFLCALSPELDNDERKCNYERYRGLVQNDFAGIAEEQCLYQIYIDELYGGMQKPNEDEKKKLAEKKASIGYTYDDSSVTTDEKIEERDEDEEEDSDEKSDSDEEIPDIDVEVDVDELNSEQTLELNKLATTYGMSEGDFVRMLRKDKEEVEAIKHAKALEEEKAMYSGRRSRRQRREFREKRLKGRKISPPSYARRDSPTYDPYKRSQSESSSGTRSRSRSNSPTHEEKITYITSFGGSEDEGGSTAQSGVATAKAPPGRHRTSNSLQSSGTGHTSSSRHRSSSSSRSSRSRSGSRNHRSRGRRRSSRYSRSRSRSRNRHYSGSHGRYGRGGSRDGRRCSRSQSRSADRTRYVSSRSRGRRSRSRSHSRSDDRYRRSSRTGYSSSRRRNSTSRSSSDSLSGSQSQSKSLSPVKESLGKVAASPAMGEKLKKSDTPVGKESGAAKPKLTPQEKLKLRMQKALNKQFKADKKAAQEKQLQQEQERQEREDELRAMARKIRLKERERRDKERDEWEKEYPRRSRSCSPRHGRDYSSSSRRRSRSRSRSPHHRH
ncbi:CLK4-associating serine/arginine rich protein [Carcharodon carcharias]|uniref:CLK4-associating serine/arginine rich protein n=1 Tax=Carcharodon carcharias TaxID=13397 RepID=UPI001B7D9FBD|nr:CLK4-associating serine/arginine rich protein [Carcharodon carcharias]XP_041035100.1 CLK4-associating serine/arginine rich protein [Carcharodon carcharias]XP_041035101.1 CLK4-associating serine/arginine rich protein [Carcharodon carcharias]XP_041035102.1 CLK4-associating serine/arginine rich protein [Carcharodon carcharias]XP_041035103.1 CLK4-associating serine/arginine rich protein [Carcharodon carcharias]